MSDEMRSSDEIIAELRTLESTEGAPPRKLGELRKEAITAVEAEKQAFNGLAPIDAKFNGAGEDRKAVATAMLCAFYERHQENTQHLGGLIRGFDEFFEAWESMVEGQGREALVTRVKDAESMVRDNRMTLDHQRARIRDLEEMNKRLADRCTANGVPV